MLHKIIICLSGCALLLFATRCAGDKNNSPQPESALAYTLRENAIAEMKKVMGDGDSSVSYFSFEDVFVACKTDTKTASRIKNYAATLLEDMQPYFKIPVHPIKIYVFSTRAPVGQRFTHCPQLVQTTWLIGLLWKDEIF